MKFLSGHRLCILMLALANSSIHLLFYNTLGFHRDELLYFSLGQHLSAGYASVPPFTGLVAWIVINTMGYSLLAVRLLPALFSGLYLLVGAGIAREMKGGTYAQVLTAAGIMVTPLNLRAFYMFQPVYFDLFIWSLFLYVILRWINSRNDKYLLLMGITAGVALMNKYLMALLILSVMVAFLFSQYRIIFRNRKFYLAVVLALVILSPNIIWQFMHNWPALIHMKALQESQLVHVDRITFITDQAFLGCMAIILIIPGIFFGLTQKLLAPYRPVILGTILVVIILALLRGKSYYTAGLLPVWIAAGSVIIEKAIQPKFWRVTLIFLLFAFTVPLVPMGIPVFRQENLKAYFARIRQATQFDMMLRWESGKVHQLPQDYADMLGWDEIASLTDQAYRQVLDKIPVMIFADNYGEAGAIMVLGKKYGLPEPACLSESFYYWFPRYPKQEITHLIYINEGETDEDLQKLFAEIRLVGSVQNPLAREYGTSVWLYSQPRKSFNAFLKEQIPNVRTPFE